MTATTTYLLEYKPVEIDRLLAMAHMLAPEVQAVCARAGLTSGGRAVDVGCGPVGGIVALRELVGDDGEVIGVDASPEAIASADAVVRHEGYTNVRLVNADINDVDLASIAQPGTVDVAFSRLALMHQPDPVATLGRIRELLRPGGSVVAFDLLRAPIVDPPIPSLDRAWELLWNGMKEIGAHPETSRMYGVFAAAAGLELTWQRGFFMPVPAAISIEETVTLLGAASGALVRNGLATNDEIDALVRDMRAAEPSTSFATTPLAIEMIARKPGVA